MRAAITPSAFVALIPTVCIAHQDAIIQIREDGNFVGLPPQFAPASIQIEFSKPESATPIKSVTITLSGKTIKIPSGIVKLLRSRSLDSVQASASWYHDDSHLPFYIRIKFIEPGFDKDRIDTPGITFTLNLRTGKVMGIGKVIITKPGKSWESRPIKPETLCSTDELKEFYSPISSAGFLK